MLMHAPTHEQLEFWRSEAEAKMGKAFHNFVVVESKTDLVNDINAAARERVLQYARAFCSRYGCALHSTSAKTNSGLSELFAVSRTASDCACTAR